MNLKPKESPDKEQIKIGYNAAFGTDRLGRFDLKMEDTCVYDKLKVQM